MKRNYQTLIDAESARVKKEIAQMFDSRISESLGHIITRNITREE